MRILALSLFTLSAASLGTPALAASTTTKAGLVAKAAYAKKTGGSLDHAHEVYSFGKDGKEFVWGWRGAKAGPGARGAYMMVVPAGKDRATMLRGTKISKNLESAGKQLVRAHLTAQGLTGRIELGDHMPALKHSWDNGKRLQQAPVTRDSGFLRYTVTERGGAQKRYIVATSPTALLTGGKVLGTVTLDTDHYGQTPVK